MKWLIFRMIKNASGSYPTACRSKKLWCIGLIWLRITMFADWREVSVLSTEFHHTTVVFEDFNMKFNWAGLRTAASMFISVLGLKKKLNTGCLWLQEIMAKQNWAASYKPNNVAVRLAKTQISLGIRPVWSESLLSAWRKLGSLATHWDAQRRLWSVEIWVFAGRTLILLVLSWGGSDDAKSCKDYSCKKRSDFVVYTTGRFMF